MTSILDFKAQTFVAADWVAGPVGLVLPSGIDVVGNTLLICSHHNLSFTSPWPDLFWYGFERIPGGGLNDALGPGFLLDWWVRRVKGTEGWAGDGTDVLDLTYHPIPDFDYEEVGRVGAYCLQGAGWPFQWDNTGFTPPWDPASPCIIISGAATRETISGPPSGLTARDYFTQGAIINGIDSMLADNVVPDSGGPFVVGEFPPGTEFQGQIVVFVPPDDQSQCMHAMIGKNRDNSPLWTRECWQSVDGWVLNGAGAALLTGETYEGDTPYHEHAAMRQGQSWLQEPEGPYDHKHIARVAFEWVSNASLMTPMAKLAYSWGGFTNYAVEPLVQVIMVDDVNGRPPGIYVWDIGDIAAFYPMTFTPGTEYTIEIDYLSGLKVRCAPTLDIGASDYIIVLPRDVVGTDIYIEADASRDKAILLTNIDIAYGPASGSLFEILVAVGNESDITFQGFPTIEGTAVWKINDITVEPESYDDATGTVTFSRPPGELAPIVQSGAYAG
jgi:hypothetical protein